MPLLFLSQAVVLVFLMDATQDFPIWYWFTRVKEVSGYMVDTNPLRRMLTVCLWMDACSNPFVCSTFFLQLEPLRLESLMQRWDISRTYLLDRGLEFDDYFNVPAH